MTDTFGPTVAKRRLSRLLAELRVKNGYTANQVCDKLNWGRGKVGRFEANTWKRPEMSDIRDLLRIYEVSDAERAELEELAVLARARRWWREYGDVFEDSEYPGFEEDAVRICVYMPLILPGLLQSRAYVEAHTGVGTQPAEWRQRALEARLRRQQVLTRHDSTRPELVAVVTEASLMYHWGRPDERRAQVEHLIGMSREPDVELRLLRFEDGPHPGMSSLISIFDFPGDEPSMVYLENDAAMKEVDNSAEVDAFAVLFGRIRDAALDTPATTAYLDHLARTLE
ncbi:MAG TPA: helix-turn-helix transcriptional regulator [Rugosimonospora sp.]|nr:helix-turn-helix transcriptional regulator [Rugosimonospora sp.]